MDGPVCIRTMRVIVIITRIRQVLTLFGVSQAKSASILQQLMALAMNVIKWTILLLSLTVKEKAYPVTTSYDAWSHPLEEVKMETGSSLA